MSIMDLIIDAIRLFEIQHTKPPSCIWLGRETYYKLCRDAEAKFALMLNASGLDTFHGIPIFKKDIPEHLEVR